MKKAYQIRLSQEMLDELKEVSQEEETSVSYEIRKAIRLALNIRKSGRIK